MHTRNVNRFYAHVFPHVQLAIQQTRNEINAYLGLQKRIPPNGEQATFTFLEDPSHYLSILQAIVGHYSFEIDDDNADLPRKTNLYFLYCDWYSDNMTITALSEIIQDLIRLRMAMSGIEPAASRLHEVIAISLSHLISAHTIMKNSVISNLVYILNRFFKEAATARECLTLLILLYPEESALQQTKNILFDTQKTLLTMLKQLPLDHLSLDGFCELQYSLEDLLFDFKTHHCSHLFIQQQLIEPLREGLIELNEVLSHEAAHRKCLEANRLKKKLPPSLSCPSLQRQFFFSSPDSESGAQSDYSEHEGLEPSTPFIEPPCRYQTPQFGCSSNE